MNKIKLEKLGGGFFAVTDSVHTFGTDALLLADFAGTKREKQACDLCSGCGIIPLLLLRNHSAQAVTAVEIQSRACELIGLSANKSGAAEKISAVNCDLREIKQHISANTFDLVTVNPPYFSVGSGKENLTDEQKIIRSEVCCTPADLARCAAWLLRSGGRLCLCHRPERLTDVICALREKKLEPKRLRFVSKSAEEAPWLFLLEARLDGKPSLAIEKPLYMSDTEELKRIYGDYAE